MRKHPRCRALPLSPLLGTLVLIKGQHASPTIWMSTQYLEYKYMIFIYSKDCCSCPLRHCSVRFSLVSLEVKPEGSQARFDEEWKAMGRYECRLSVNTGGHLARPVVSYPCGSYDPLQGRRGVVRVTFLLLPFFSNSFSLKYSICHLQQHGWT